MTAKLRLRRRKHIIFKESESPDTQSPAARKHYPAYGISVCGITGDRGSSVVV